MSEAQRTYRRDLALYCLTRETRPVTAADLAIGMQAAAQTEGHPRALWLTLDGVIAGGVLRTLSRAGQAEVADQRRDTALGRDVPLWRASSSERTPMPLPPNLSADPRDIENAAPQPRGGTLPAPVGDADFAAELRALCAHQAQFIARWVEVTRAPQVANDE